MRCRGRNEMILSPGFPRIQCNCQPSVKCYELKRFSIHPPVHAPMAQATNPIHCVDAHKRTQNKLTHACTCTQTHTLLFSAAHRSMPCLASPAATTCSCSRCCCCCLRCSSGCDCAAWCCLHIIRRSLLTSCWTSVGLWIKATGSVTCSASK